VRHEPRKEYKMEDTMMPEYRTRAGKREAVYALKIKKIMAARPAGAPYGRRMIEVEDIGFAPVEVSAEFMKMNPEPGGYYVVCQGGAKAYMTAKDFEKRYKAIK